MTVREATVLPELTALARLDELVLPFAWSGRQLAPGVVLVVEATPARREHRWEIVSEAQLVGVDLFTARVREQTSGHEFTAWITLGGR